MRKSASLVAAAAFGSLIALALIDRGRVSHAQGGAVGAEGHQAQFADAKPAAKPDTPPTKTEPTTAPPTEATPGQTVYAARAGQPVVPVAGAPTSFVELVKRAMPSVVNIHTTALIKQRPVAVFPFGEDSPFYRLVQPPDERAQSLGTGFIISSDGDIITNNHVVAPEELGGRVADEIVVLLSDKRQFKARVVARDPQTEVALLHIDAHDLQPAELGDSNKLEVGEWVVAIGEPYGLSSTVTAGIVSAKGRRGDDLGGMNSGYWDFIQTDAAINPGNSGGPLYDMHGNVVGINTAINARAQGLAFAVPIDMAKSVVADFKKFGKVQRSWIGIRPLDAAASRQVGIVLSTGALVNTVVANSPAAKAGIRRGDIVLKFDDVVVDDAERLRWLSANAGVGRKIKLRVKRGRQEADVEVTSVAQPD